MTGLAKKQETVETLKTALAKGSVVYVTDYRGLSVSELTTLRRELYKENACFTVAKNTLMKRAIKGTEFEVLEAVLSGPTAITVAEGDQVAPLKIIRDFLKKGKKANEIRGGVLEGNLLSQKEVTELASLPPINELRAQLLGALMGPQRSLVSAINSPSTSLVRALDQIAKQKQAQG